MDLIAKLVAAKVGSRELSDDVLLACGWECPFSGDPRDWHWKDPDGNLYDYWTEPRARHDGPKPHRPCPTTSLDAARTLIPEGWTWYVAEKSEDSDQAHCCVWVPGPSGPNKKSCGSYGKSPELALCIASLRARQA